MHARPEPDWQTYRGNDTPPPQAAELLGNDVTKRFADYAQGNATTEPIALAAVDEQGRWLAAILLLIEPMQDADETVGSIHQLIVPPASRGQGLAGRLIRRAMTTAKDAGAARLRSTAGWGCPDHLAMYDRLRFDRLNARELPYLVSKPLDR
ncbi:GNAT family N-acetyltransferase [Phycisphaerales bacterium AB-hyl4]|uniref:GNAT family N-acetyltransferase n=1 Tax=Natronomicrosphaera hydrolytica TaxID=3242702 RepID=A0ABV4U1Z8_9BACT